MNYNHRSNKGLHVFILDYATLTYYIDYASLTYYIDYATLCISTFDASSNVVRWY